MVWLDFMMSNVDVVQSGRRLGIDSPVCHTRTSQAAMNVAGRRAEFGLAETEWRLNAVAARIDKEFPD
jgi:hypothetical protein